MIHYVVGDATDPQVPGNRIIAHVCNDTGGWGRGFVLSLSKRWPEPELAYRRWHQEGAEMLLIPGHSGEKVGIEMKLGATIYVRVAYRGNPPDFEDETFVANMVAQRGILPDTDGTPPIRYDALETCLKDVKKMIDRPGPLKGATVHMPRIGCGLAGGKWSEVEPIIERSLTGVEVYVYDFNTGDARTVPWTK